jgi:hypothetical protein
VKHILQLFDEPRSRSASVAEFIERGMADGEGVVVVMQFRNWQDTAVRLARGGMDLEAVIRSGQLTVCDAAEMMGLLMRQGRPSRELFEQSAAALVRGMAARWPVLRIYGEMVDLLAAEGNLGAALELEELWNDLAAREPFTLFCGYSSLHFGNASTHAILRQICGTHSHVRSNRQDTLATFLVAAAASAPDIR